MKKIRSLALVLLLACLTTGHSAAAAAKRLPPADECKTLGMTIASELSRRDADAFAAQFDFDAMYDRVVTGIPGAEKAPANDRTDFRNNLIRVMKNVAKSVTHAAFIRFEGRSGEGQVLLRVEMGDDDFNYWFLTVAYTGTSNPKVVDLLALSNGENTSESMRRIALPILAENNKSFLQKLSGEQSEFIKHQDEFTGFFKLSSERKYAAALASYQRLPASLKQNKSAQIICLRATSHAAPEKFPEAVRQYSALFPGDPSLAYYKYIAHRDTEKYAEALLDIDEMEKAFGPDNFFHQLRARAYIKQEKWDEAVAAAQQSLSARRTLGVESGLYMGLLARTSRFDDLARFLRELERDNDKMEMYSLMRKDPIFASFFKSEPFRKWMESPLKHPVAANIRPNFNNAPAATPAASTPTSAAPAAKTPEQPKAPEPAYKLGGILYSPKSPAAIINGKTVYVGDKIKEAKVIKIEQTTVTLEIDGKMEELKLK